MNIQPTRIFPLGDGAITVEFGNELSIALNDAAICLAKYLSEYPFPGLIEAVPAMASVAVFYDQSTVRRTCPSYDTIFSAVRDLVSNALLTAPVRHSESGRLVTIPARFSGDDAPDLDLIASFADLSIDDAIEIFLSVEYRVFMLGFLPGFPYLGAVDERIAIPRRATPRTSVPKGSIGIAGRQTGIYPSASPGGWQIIGRTEEELIDASVEPPFIFSPGDRVRFVRA